MKKCQTTVNCCSVDTYEKSPDATFRNGVNKTQKNNYSLSSATNSNFYRWCLNKIAFTPKSHVPKIEIAATINLLYHIKHQALLETTHHSIHLLLVSIIKWPPLWNFSTPQQATLTPSFYCSCAISLCLARHLIITKRKHTKAFTNVLMCIYFVL